jgi:hypothetical protein
MTSSRVNGVRLLASSHKSDTDRRRGHNLFLDSHNGASYDSPKPLQIVHGKFLCTRFAASKTRPAWPSFARFDDAR